MHHNAVNDWCDFELTSKMITVRSNKTEYGWMCRPWPTEPVERDKQREDEAKIEKQMKKLKTYNAKHRAK